MNEIIARRGRIDYTLVYAPEGFYADIEIDDETFPDLTDEKPHHRLLRVHRPARITRHDDHAIHERLRRQGRSAASV